MINIQKLFSYDIVSNPGFSNAEFIPMRGRYFEDGIRESLIIKTRQNIKYNIRRIRLDLLLNRKERE